MSELADCPWCEEGGEPLACQLDTTPKTYAVRCSECGAQGPAGDSFEEANEEWNQQTTDDVPAFTVAMLTLLGAVVAGCQAVGMTPGSIVAEVARLVGLEARLGRGTR